MQYTACVRWLGGLLLLSAMAATAGVAQTGAAPAVQAPGFRVTLVAPREGADRFRPVVAWLEGTELLDRVAAMMNGTVRLPAPVALVADECGEPDAYYRKEASGASIILCYEMVLDVVERFRRADLTTLDRAAAQTGSVAYVVFHEIGHALIDQLRLPVTARVEGGADEFAALVLSSGDRMAAYWAASYLRPLVKREDAVAAAVSSKFVGEHALDALRLSDLLCWSFGADPRSAWRYVRSGALSAERADKCPAEYARVSTVWEALLAPHTAVGALARARTHP
jgi:hypothetical protein